MSKSFLISKKYVLSFVTTVFSLVLIFSAPNFASANDWTFRDTFESHNQGDLDGQGGWKVTNYYANPNDAVDVVTTDTDEGTKYVEIKNQDSIITTHDIVPVDAGIFQFRMRHNKSGLFYFYALTSDAGGQLLFSIQFTESDGIRLEEASKQITLLPDYNADQWYLFTIDFDSTRGARGTFKIKIDDGSYSEYEYVNSESALFDFAQMVFGSESNGTAISAFGDIQSSPIATTTPTVEPKSSLLDNVLGFFSKIIGLDDTATSTDSLANVISAVSDTASTTSNDSSVATSTEEQTAPVVVSDTNAPSITSPIPDETATSTSPEAQNATSSVSADTNSNGTTTTTF